MEEAKRHRVHVGERWKQELRGGGEAGARRAARLFFRHKTKQTNTGWQRTSASSVFAREGKNRKQGGGRGGENTRHGECGVLPMGCTKMMKARWEKTGFVRSTIYAARAVRRECPKLGEASGSARHPWRTTLHVRKRAVACPRPPPPSIPALTARCSILIRTNAACGCACTSATTARGWG